MNESTAPDPEDLEITDDGSVQPAGEEIPPGHDQPTPGAPTAEELEADRVLYPEPTDDSVPDGSQVPTGDDVDEEGDRDAPTEDA